MAGEPVIKLYVIVAGEPRFQGSARVFDDEPNADVEANISRALGTTSESAADIFAAFMNDADNFPAGSVPVVEWKLSEVPEHITMSAAVFACITMPATMKIGKNLSDDPGDAVSRSTGGSSRGF